MTTAGIPYDALVPGQALGQYSFDVSRSVVEAWREVREDNPPDLTPWLAADRAPEGLAFAYVLRTLMDLAVIPPGGVLARQDLRFRGDIPIGSRLSIAMSCCDKSLRKGRPFATLRLRIDVEGETAMEVDKHVLWPSAEPARYPEASTPPAQLPSPAYPLSISQHAVVRYAELSNDRNPLHLDAEFATRGPFGALVVHGVIPAGLLLETIALTPPFGGSLAAHRCTVRYVKPLHPAEPFRLTRQSDVGPRRTAPHADAPAVAAWHCESWQTGTLVAVEAFQLQEGE